MTNSVQEDAGRLLKGNAMTYEPAAVEKIGTFTHDTADNRRYWSIDWHITGKKK